MAEQPPKPEYYYFEHDGNAYTVPSTDTEALQNFVYRLGAKPISEYDKNVLVERRNLRDAGALGYLEAGARGLASGLTLSTSQFLGDPVRQKAITEEFPGTFYGTDIATSLATSILSSGATAAAKGAVTAPKLLAEGAEAVGAKALLESGEQVAARTAAQEAGQAPLGQFLPVTSRQLVAREAGEEAAEEVAEAGARIGLRDIAERTLPGMVTRGVEGVTNKILAKAAGDSVLESAIRTVAPYTVPAALESGIYGFTQGMADQYLNDPYSSDAVLAAAGLEAGSSAFLFGGGVGLGLTGTITTAKLTPAAITKTAKAIYKPLADNFGDKFASGLGKFVASEDPRVQKAFTEQLTGILQFNDEAQGFAVRMQRLQDQVADMRDRGVEQAVIAKTYDDEIKALRIDKAELDAKSKQAAKSLKGLQETLSEQRKGIEKELGLQQQELLAGVAEDLQEALASQRNLAAFFGDTTTKSGTKSVSKVDAAIRENLKDASLDYNAIFQNVKSPNGSLRAAVNELESAATEAAARGSAEISQSLKNAARELDNFSKLDIPVERNKLIEFYLEQRRALRRADLDISRADELAKATKGAERMKLSDTFGAMGRYRAYTSSPEVFGKAGRLEGARSSIQRALMGLRLPDKAKRGKRKADPYTVISADDLQKTSDLLNRQLDSISDFIDEGALKGLRDAVGRISAAAGKATKKVESVNEFNRVANELGALLGKGKNATLPKGTQLQDLVSGAQIEEAMQGHFDEILGTFNRAVDEAKTVDEFTDAMQAISDDILFARRKSQEATRLKDDFIKRAQDPDIDPDIQALLSYRSGKKGVDGVGAFVMANLLGIPEEFVAAGLGVSSARNNPLSFLNGVAAVASAANKADQKATQMAKKALNIVTDPNAPPMKLKKRQSVMGKLIGLPTGISNADGSVNEKEFDKAVKKVQEYQANPKKREALLTKIDSPYPQFSDFALSTKTKVTVAVDFLNSLVPIPPPPPPFQRKEYEVPTEVKRNFAAAVDQINDPEGQFFSELSQGTISEDAMTPMRAVYPDLYAHLLTKTVEVFSSSNVEIPFSTRLALGFTIGPDMIPAMNPSLTMMMQQNISQPLAGQEQQGGVNMTQGGVGKLSKSAATYETPGQRMMGA